MISHVLLAGLGTAVALGLLLAVPALALRRNDLADVFWGPGFLAAALGAWWFGFPGRAVDNRLLVTLALVGVWGARLFWHVGRRWLSHGKEDARYAKWRREWGATWAWRSVLQVFLLQPLILFVIALSPLWVVAHPGSELTVLSYVGIAIWLFGFSFEAVADAQLRRFTRDPSQKGKILDTGLWAWSRHPNYFGEVAQWWGIFLLALPLPMGWVTLLSPVTITFLILKVSGVSMLEAAMEKRPGWAEYRARTAEFFPRPPKRQRT